MGSNHRPPDYQSGALPTELPEHVAEGVGFEPTEAFVSQVFRTSALNHSAIPPYGSHGWSRTNLPGFRARCSTDELHGYVEAAEGIEPTSPGSKPDAQTAVLCRYVVGQVGFEPTMFLTSQFYRLLPSPIWILTHMVTLSLVYFGAADGI